MLELFLLLVGIGVLYGAYKLLKWLNAYEESARNIEFQQELAEAFIRKSEKDELEAQYQTERVARLKARDPFN